MANWSTGGFVLRFGATGVINVFARLRERINEGGDFGNKRAAAGEKEAAKEWRRKSSRITELS